MRIIGGTAKGRKLAVFPDRQIRPTPDRVREAVFSILFSRIGPLAGKSVLDLFAGTGAMSLEALSRGASRAVLVDQGMEAARIIPANLKTCRMEERTVFMRADVPSALHRLAGSTFDLIFLDPPYGQGLVAETVAAVSRLALLAPAGVLCAEAGRQDEIPDTCGDLVCVDRRHYGSTGICLFTRQNPET